MGSGMVLYVCLFLSWAGVTEPVDAQTEVSVKEPHKSLRRAGRRPSPGCCDAQQARRGRSCSVSALGAEQAADSGPRTETPRLLRSGTARGKKT